MSWKLAENESSKISIIILFLFIFYITEFIIVNIVNIDLDKVSILISLVIAIPTIIIHELIHFFMGLILVKNRRKIWIGVNVKKFSAFTNIDGEYSFFGLIIYTIAPFILLTVVLGFILYINKIMIPCIWIVVFYNSFMAVMDIRNTFFIIKNYNKKTKFKIEEFYLYYCNEY